MPVVSCISRFDVGEVRCKTEYIAPHFCGSSVLRCTLCGTPLLFEGSEECFGNGIVMWSCCGGKGLLHTAFLQQRCKRGRCVLLAAVAVKSQTIGIAAFTESGSECAGDQICTGIAGYSITDDLAGEQVENGAEIHPVVIDFEVCNIADPNLIWMVGSELAFQ